jgi:hypothetical protein
MLIVVQAVTLHYLASSFRRALKATEQLIWLPLQATQRRYPSLEQKRSGYHQNTRLQEQKQQRTTTEIVDFRPNHHIHHQCREFNPCLAYRIVSIFLPYLKQEHNISPSSAQSSPSTD